MSKQLVDFEQGTDLTGDSNERGNGSDGVDAIKPYDDGEPATAAVFDRPVENMRQRSEVLRSDMEDQKYLADSDMRWILTKGLADGTGSAAIEPYITTWNTITGIFVTSDAVVVQPLNTPPEDMTEEIDYLFPPGVGTGTLHVEMTRYAYDLANLREIHWVPKLAAEITGGVAGYCDFKLVGTDGHILEIWYENSTPVGAATLTDILTLIGLYGPGGTDVLDPAGFVLTVVGSGAQTITASDFDDYTPPGTLTSHYFTYKTADRELHYVTPSAFSDFFLTPANGLADGDTLAIYFQYLVDPGSTNGRRQRIPGNANTSVAHTELFNTRVEPGKIPGCIPVCKRIGNDLLWLDGTFVGPTISPVGGLHFGEHGYTVERIYSAPTTVPITMTSKWFGTAAPAWATISTALNGIVSDLAGTQTPASVAVNAVKGATLMGAVTTAHAAGSWGLYNIASTPAESVQTALSSIIALLNNKASLNQGAAFGGEEIVTGRWKFNNHVVMGQDYSVLRAAPSDTSYHLVYRNGGISEVGVVLWSTTSIYETVNSATGENCTITVVGGFLSAQDKITSVTGAGVVTFQMLGRFTFSGSSRTYNRITGFKNVTGGPVILDINDTTAWDYFEGDYESGSDQHHEVIGVPTSSSLFNIPTQWVNQIDVIGAYFGATSTVVKIDALPLNHVMEGLHTLPEDTNDADIWTAETIVLSPGRAFVNGHPYTFPYAQTLVLGSPTGFNLMNGVVLPTQDTSITPGPGESTGMPAWYYLWLRSDGTFFIGSNLPVQDYAAAVPVHLPYGPIPGSYLYRPDHAEVHATFTQADYVLLDVVALMRLHGGLYYFDTTLHISGSERRFLARKLPGTVTSIDLKFMSSGIAAGATDLTCFLPYNGSPGSAWRRCPGIPVGVSTKAKIYYHFSYNIPAVTPGPAITLALELNYSDYAESESYSRALEISRTPPILADADIQGVDAGSIDTLCFVNALRGSLSNSAGLGLTGTIYASLLGFYWDRNSGMRLSG